MLYKEKAVVLRDGRLAIFRSPKDGDAEELLRYMVKRAEETENMLRDPDECGSVNETAEAIRHVNASQEDVWIICEIDDRIAGCCEMERQSLRKTFHRANLSMGNLKAFWGLGIGTIMLREMINIARERGITQLELNVFEGNERAMKLYRKLGFEVVAERPNCIHLSDGRRLKAYTMFLTLE